MFKNTVFKPSVNTQKWAKAAVIRAIKKWHRWQARCLLLAHLTKLHGES